MKTLKIVKCMKCGKTPYVKHLGGHMDRTYSLECCGSKVVNRFADECAEYWQRMQEKWAWVELAEMKEQLSKSDGCYSWYSDFVDKHKSLVASGNENKKLRKEIELLRIENTKLQDDMYKNERKEIIANSMGRSKKINSMIEKGLKDEAAGSYAYGLTVQIGKILVRLEKLEKEKQ